MTVSQGLMSAELIKDACLDPEKMDEWVRAFEHHEFSALPEGKRLGIVPFDVNNLGTVSYDLTVGGQAYSLRRAEKIKLVSGGEPLRIDPAETVLILTQEFIALGPTIAGITLSRARIMNEGVALSSAKIDPTWYGCLQIPVTNNSLSSFSLEYGQRFCTILLFELEKGIEPARYLTQENTPHLGQKTLKYEPRHAIPWQPKRAEKVCDEDMNNAVAFGPPFDVIRGMFHSNQQKIVDYMEKQWGVNALRDLKRSAWEEEFQQIKEFRQQEIALLKEQIEILKTDRRTQFTLAITVLSVTVALIAAVGTLVWRLLQASGNAASGTG